MYRNFIVYDLIMANFIILCVLSRQSEDWAIYTFQDFESCD